MGPSRASFFRGCTGNVFVIGDGLFVHKFGDSGEPADRPTHGMSRHEKTSFKGRAIAWSIAQRPTSRAGSLLCSCTVHIYSSCVPSNDASGGLWTQSSAC